MYTVVALLALQVAFDQDRERLDSDGAIAAVARQPFGKVLLVLLALGFLSYVIWRGTEAIASHPHRDHDAPKRVVNGGRALIYVGLFLGALGALFEWGVAGGGGSEQEWTAKVLDWPGGRWLVGAVGVALIGGGMGNVASVVTGKWRKKIDTSGRSEAFQNAVEVVATVGLLARAAVFAAIGTFVIKAAVEYDPKEAVGLDGALHRLARGDAGPAILTAVAIGLLAFALYTALQAAFRPTAEA
jgi:hypothetical protein